MSGLSAQIGEIPPIANRGVYRCPDGVPSPQFDWYGATVCERPGLVLDVLEQAFLDAGEDTVRSDGGKVRRYDQITFISDRRGRKLVAVKHGGAYPFPHVEGEGAASPVVAHAIRSLGVVHRPTRIDSALDQTKPGLFADLHALAREFERRFRLQLNYAGAAVDNDDRGTTIYLGSRRSQVFLRIYQKGLQVAEQQGLSASEITPDLLNWVRCEVVFRPDKPVAKAFASRAAPAEVWGVSTWTRDFAARALSIDAKRVSMSERKESDHERALRFMAVQYRAHLQRLLLDCQGDYVEAMGVLVDLAGLSEPQEAR